MDKIAIVTDTNSGIPAHQAQEMGIYLIPMPFFIDGETFLEGKDITADEFFDKMRAGADVSTSQPALTDITGAWDEALKTHDKLLHFPMSSSLSGTCATAKALAQEYNGRVLVVDDHRISIPLMVSILNARVMIGRGMTAEEIRDALEAEGMSGVTIYISVNTLEYLKKSGRVTAAAAAMASILGLKPVLQIQGGKLDAFKKVRGMVHAKKAMFDALREDLRTRFAEEKVRVYCAYAGSKELGRAWAEEVRAAFPDLYEDSMPLPLSICCHTGEGALGVGCVKVW